MVSMLPRDSRLALKRRADYRPPVFLIDEVALEFDLDPDATRVTSTLRFRRNPGAVPGDRHKPLLLDGEQQEDVRVDARWPGARRGARRAAPHGPDDPPSARRRHAGRALDDRPVAQRGARGPVPLLRRVLHAVRARGLPPHHLLSRPSRRAGALHGDAARRTRALSGAAVQRQPRGPRGPRRRPALRDLARPVSQALVPLRAGRRRPRRAGGPLHDALRARGGAGHLLHAPQPQALPPRDGLAQGVDALGRGALRPRVRPRPLHDLLRRRLQHGRDGEQGAQHLQQPAGARRRARRRPTRTTRRSRAWSATSTSTTGPATGSPAATGSSSRSRRASRSSATRSSAATAARARWSASPRSSTCGATSSPRMPDRWRTRCARTSTRRSTTSTRRPSTRRAPRSSACSRRCSGPRRSAAAWTSTSRATTARRSPATTSCAR